MKRVAALFLVAAGTAALVWAALFYVRHLRGAGPAIQPPPADIVKTINTTGTPLTLPPGASISIFAKDLPGVRVMAFDNFGNLWVSQTGEGLITLLEVENGRVVGTTPVFQNLRRPHGLAFDPQDPLTLYFVEEDKVSRVRVYSESDPEKLVDLPSGEGHFTRTLGFGPDGRLYVAVGSSCNVCVEEDERRAKIFSMKKDGTDFREYARGLRNAVFFTWDPKGRMWATEMGRDRLGEDIPPDEIDLIREGGHYGWPECYGKNVLDADFHRDDHVHIRPHCLEPFEVPSYVDIPAHSAPLGLAFVPEEAEEHGWPEEYAHDLLVAYHGSWNRTVPTGYKVVRVPLDASGRETGPTEDFVTGWLTKDGALGRPVDIILQPGGVMYLSDDKAGVIYRLAF